MRDAVLLDQAEAAGFDILLTVDRGFQHQQNLSGRTISVVLMVVLNNSLPVLAALVPQLDLVLPAVQAGGVYVITLPPPSTVPPTP